MESVAGREEAGPHGRSYEKIPTIMSDSTKRYVRRDAYADDVLLYSTPAHRGHARTGGSISLQAFDNIILFDRCNKIRLNPRSGR